MSSRLPHISALDVLGLELDARYLLWLMGPNLAYDNSIVATRSPRFRSLTPRARPRSAEGVLKKSSSVLISC